ncbi:hypothetical protein AA313_de0203055 [Arthrobotrys entomopaga]|nr:hypothetical protein AA313_de0203055 [Arthrobotrys entomopaga]
MIYNSVVLLALLSSTNALYTVKRQAARQFLFENITPSKEIQWHPCNATQEVYMECARLIVPLDYKNIHNGLEAIVPIVKYPTNATGKDYKGAVLTNPGGPGYLGTEFIYSPRNALDIARNITGPGYDILGFDIRGVGYSIPYGACNITATDLFDPLRQNATRGAYTKREEKRDAKSQSSIPPGALNTEVAYGFYVPRLPPQFIEQITQYGDSLNEACIAYTGADNQAGPYMNTAVIATDMLSIAKALARSRCQNDTKTLVHYYGVSYGSVLGQTFATMYPDHVGKFVLDGVVDMDGWQARTEYDIVRHLDEGVFQFFRQCSDAGPQRCAFATGTSYQDVIDRFNNMTSRFNATKYEVEKSVYAPAVLSAVAQLKSTILNAMYSSILEWEGLSVLLSALDEATTAPFEEWNVTAITEIFALPLQSPSSRPLAPLQERPYSFYQTGCGDAFSVYNTTVSPAQQEVYVSSSVVAGTTRMGDRIICSRYQIRPKWEWHDRIGGTPKTPILFIGNTLDPVTPWEDAVKASVKFTGSQTVIVDLIAHSAFASENTCAYSKMRAYFQSGKMPGSDYHCPEGRRPFT